MHSRYRISSTIQQHLSHAEFVVMNSDLQCEAAVRPYLYEPGNSTKDAHTNVAHVAGRFDQSQLAYVLPRLHLWSAGPPIEPFAQHSTLYTHTWYATLVPRLMAGSVAASGPTISLHFSSMPSVFDEGGVFPALPQSMSELDLENLTAYKYEPLDVESETIRLVELLPTARSWTHPVTKTPAIVLRIIHHNLQPDSRCIDNGWSPKHFCALSYVWGEASAGTRRIYIVSSSGRPDYKWRWSYITIRKNLHDFLWYYRYTEEIRGQYIWIDQLSVDQVNLAERSSQVKLMASIYQQAGWVVAWLGCEAATITAAQFLNSKAIHHRNQAHITLLKNAYFTRLWIVQEILLAKKVYLLTGSTSISLSRLDCAYQKVVTNAVFNCGPYLVWDHNRDAVFGKRKVVECIERYSKNECANPRDRVYGLLGIVQSGGDVEVDYTKQCSEVYRDGLKLLHEESTREVGKDKDKEKRSERYLKAATRLAENMGAPRSEIKDLETVKAAIDWKSCIEPLIGSW